MIIKLGKYKLNICRHDRKDYKVSNIECQICSKCDKVFKNKVK